MVEEIAGCARHHRQPRECAAVGAQVRPDIRQPDPAEVAPRPLTGEGSAALDELRVMLNRAARRRQAYATADAGCLAR
jgi:hypothetical protein